MIGLVRNPLSVQYSAEKLFFTDPLFKDNDYYVIRQDGRVVAGIQIYPVTWKIVDIHSLPD